MKRATLAAVAAFAAVAATAATVRNATEDWTRNRITAATNATLTAANDYTDKAVAGAGGVTPAAVTNIAQNVAGEKIGERLDDYKVKIGIDASTPSGYSNVAIGSHSTAAAIHSVAIGSFAETEAGKEDTIAIGHHAKATDKESVAIGVNATTHGEGTITLGQNGMTPGNVYIGNKTLAQAISAAESDPTVPAWAKQPNPPESMTDNAAVLTNGTLKTKGGAAITPANIGAATTAAAQAAQRTADEAAQQSEETRAVVVQLAGQINGSNVVFVVTNYISGAYVLDAAKLQIRELRDGAYRTIYNSRDEINLHLADFETNKLNTTREELRREIAAVLESMSHDAWGRRTSTGNPAPSNTVYTTEPQFVFGGGLEYERIAVGAGSVGILCDKGAPTFTAGDRGTFMFKDATGENYFGYSMTSGYAIGVPTDGIRVEGQRVTLTYNLVGSCPIIMWCPRLFPGCESDITQPGWFQLNDDQGNPVEGAPFECAIDTESTPEVATVYINTGANPTGFFSAWTSAPGKSSFKTNMPVDLNAENGGGVISSDGRTVLIPQPDGTWRPSNANN